MYVLPQHLVLSAVDGSLQQTIANTDQIREVEERIQSLGAILTYPMSRDDGEEKARREVFRRFVLPPSGYTGTFLIIYFSQEVG